MTSQKDQPSKKNKSSKFLIIAALLLGVIGILALAAIGLGASKFSTQLETEMARAEQLKASNGLKSLGIAALLAQGDNKGTMSIAELIKNKYLDRDPNKDNPNYTFTLEPAAKTLNLDSIKVMGYARPKDNERTKAHKFSVLVLRSDGSVIEQDRLNTGGK